MKREYDFSRAKRGPIVPPAKGKTRITIRVDDEVLAWFRAQVHGAGGGNYQTLMNGALHEYMTRNEGALAETLRQVLREELAPYLVPSPRAAPVRRRRLTRRSDHRLLDARSLALHALIVRKIARDPRLLGVARRNLDRWRAARGTEAPALAEWRAILARPWKEVAAVLTDSGEEATRLRQSSPFAGVLTSAERRRIYEAFRA